MCQEESQSRAAVPLFGISALHPLKCGTDIPATVVGTYAPPAVPRSHSEAVKKLGGCHPERSEGSLQLFPNR